MDDVRLLLLQHFFVVGIPGRDAELLGQLAGRFRITLRQRHDLGARDPADRFDMLFTNKSTADDGDTQCLHHSIGLPFILSCFLMSL